MNTKILLITILIAALVLPVVAGKRKPGPSMKELTDPNSPSFVPFPYPKNRDELIADIKYYHCDLSEKSQTAFLGGLPLTKKIPADLFKQHPISDYATKKSRAKIIADMYKAGTNYKIGKIVKVKSLMDQVPGDYYWLVYVMDKEGDSVMRITMLASGLGMSASAIDKTDLNTAIPQKKEKLKRLLKVLAEKEVKTYFTTVLGPLADDSKIVKVERLSTFGRLGDFVEPIWRLTLTGGENYYYSELQHQVYREVKKIPWKSERGIQMPPRRSNGMPYRHRITDRFNDKFIVLEPIPWKNGN